MTNETHAAFTLFYHQLTTDAPLVALVGTRVYEEFKSGAAPYPRVLITFLAGQDVMAVGGDRRFLSKPMFLVEALTMADDFVQAAAIDARFDPILEGLSGTVGPLSISVTAREGPMKRVEITPEGQRINHLGGRYRAWISGQAG